MLFESDRTFSDGTPRKDLGQCPICKFWVFADQCHYVDCDKYIHEDCFPKYLEERLDIQHVY